VGPVFDAELAQRLGLPEKTIPVRLLSLVSLGYVEQLLVGTKDGGYTLTDRSRRTLAEAADIGAGSSHPVSGQSDTRDSSDLAHPHGPAG
jgi:hypothetical protein